MHPLHTLLNSQPVQWKTLGEVAKISSGGTPKTEVDAYYNGDIPWLRTQEVNFGEIWGTDIKITEEGVANSSAKWVPANSVILAMYGATVGKVAMNRIPLTTNQACANIQVDANYLNYRYLFYYLYNKYEYIKSLGTGSQTNINAQIVKGLKIPIPSLSVQQRIVEILDNFTACIDALNKEHTLRKKQYAHYRDLLLSEAELSKVGFEWKTLGEVFHIGAGGDVPKESLSPVQTEEFKYPILSNGIGENALYGWTAQAKITEPSLTISARGTIGWTSHRDTPFFPIVRLLVLTPKIDIVLKYAYYFMKCIENSYKVPEGGIPQLTKPMIKDIAIPIPPLPHQQKIVEILDRFDTLTNSITQGLPREIELRRKQYEYYRELLLTFD